MPLLALGVSHHHANAAQLSALLAAGETVLAEFRQQDLAAWGIRGYVLLVTCNRWELYLDSVDCPLTANAVHAQLRTHAGEDLAALIQTYDGTHVASHLFAVTAGLDSMVIGDDQIAHQVRESLYSSVSAPTGALYRLFDKALATSKLVTSNTRLGRHSRSIATAGLDLVAADFDIAHSTILLLGTGAFARVVVTELKRRGAAEIIVGSAAGRATDFAQSQGITGCEDLQDACCRAQLIVACSGAAEPPLTAQVLQGCQPLTIIDLSLRGNVAADVVASRRHRILTLDDVAAQEPGESRESLSLAQSLIAHNVDAYVENEQGRSADAAIVALRQYVGDLVAVETATAQARLAPGEAAAVADALRRFSGAILHKPTLRATELARQGSLDDYIAALHTLLEIEV